MELGFIFSVNVILHLEGAPFRCGGRGNKASLSLSLTLSIRNSHTRSQTSKTEIAVKNGKRVYLAMGPGHA